MDAIRVEGRAASALDAVLAERRSALVAIGVIAILVLGGVYAAVRGSPARIAPPSTYESSFPSATPGAVAVGEAVMVHVAGAVKRPGLYPLPAGSRFADAIVAAGGPTTKADLDLVNLAQFALDGTKVEVPKRGNGRPGGPGTVADPASIPSAPPVISLNAADQAALETIPGIGPVTAAAILQHRDEIGGFTSLEQLLDVSGIGPATYESMRDFVSL